MDAQGIVEKSNNENPFWKNATRYTSSATNDEKFVGEIAYLLVTLHRTGS